MSASDKLVKEPYSKISFTPEQLRELRACAHPDTGPEYFISNYIWVQHPTKGRMLLNMFDYQRDLLNVYHQNRKSINLLGRQLGKCFLSHTNISIKNKKSQVFSVPVGIFFLYQVAKQNNYEYIPDLSQFLVDK